jgi:hypothetical protein
MRKLKYIKKFNESIDNNVCRVHLITDASGKGGLNVSSGWDTSGSNAYLHITDPSEEISEGDYFITKQMQSIRHDKKRYYVISKCTGIENSDIISKIGKFNKNDCEKVIMTQNKKLNLEKIPDNFIKEYVKRYNKEAGVDKWYPGGDPMLKVTIEPNGEITIID